MSNPGLHKLGRIVAYILQENVHQDEMQGRYDAAKIIDRIIKEIKLGEAIKQQQPRRGRKGKGKKNA